MTPKPLELTQAEFYEKYGDEIVAFNVYSKYVFHFFTKLPDDRILNCQVGGDPESIHEFYADYQMRIRLRDLKPYACSIYGKTGEEEYFYNY